MAGGKLSARQKMINLMYLVFIAMMAMNMSKEVLSAFGLMEAKFTASNLAATDKNSALLADLEIKGKEKKEEFAVPAVKAKQVSIISDDFYNYIATLKADLLKEGKYEIDPETKKLPFESMDKTDILDEKWFTGDRLSKPGEAVMARIEKYKKDIKDVLGTDVSYTKAIESFDNRFNTNKVENNDGKKIDWLAYHFKGFPAIASYTKLTAMQNDIKITESNMMNLFLGNATDVAISLNKYKAIVLADKSAFFAGEKFQGRVVIGKYANVTPTKLVVQGEDINIAEAVDSSGAARLDFNVGNVGEHNIEGEFTFMENDKELKIPIINANYVVVPRPNSATISADKMNVVYRGVQNPMTISFAGVPDNKVNASAPGLDKVGNGKYVMNPGTGREVTINVTATLDDGSPARDSKTFRIKDIPKPTGTVNGQDGTVKLPRNNVEIARIGAKLEDFDFELPIEVTSFKMKVPNQPSVSINGTRLNTQAKNALRKARRGDGIQFFDIKARITNNPNYKLKGVSPVFVELSN
ncbi:MAG: gliding motility protein GldM [Bacteroidota bacterium]